MSSPAVTICTNGYKLHKFYILHTHSALLWFVWILEQTEIIYLYSSSYLVFIKET